MGKLREQMVREMEVRNYSPRTIEAYVGHMVAFTRLFQKSPADMGAEEVRHYLHSRKTVRRVSSSNINIAYCALKFFYEQTLHHDWQVEQLPRPRGETRLPVVLSLGDVRRVLEAVSNRTHRVFLETTYSAGLRMSETAHLKITDIDSQRMLIRVEQGKGKKDRSTLLSATLLQDLRAYWRVERPAVWLFPGKCGDEPLSVTTIQKAFTRAKKKSGF
jgi:site-specific recombinase XerD